MLLKVIQWTLAGCFIAWIIYDIVVYLVKGPGSGWTISEWVKDYVRGHPLFFLFYTLIIGAVFLLIGHFFWPLN